MRTERIDEGATRDISDAEPPHLSTSTRHSALGTRHSALHPLAWLAWAGASTLVVATTRNPLYLLLVDALRRGGVSRGTRQSSGALIRPQWSLVLRAAWTLTTICHSLQYTDRSCRRPRPLHAAAQSAADRVGDRRIGDAKRPALRLLSALALGTLILIFAALNVAVGYEELLRLLPGPLTGLGVTMTVALGFLPQTIAALGEVREAQAVRGHTARRGAARGLFWQPAAARRARARPRPRTSDLRSPRRWPHAASASRDRRKSARAPHHVSRSPVAAAR